MEVQSKAVFKNLTWKNLRGVNAPIIP